MNYKNMTNEEIKEQLEWSDSHEFSYGYSMWAFKEIERLNNIIKILDDYVIGDRMFEFGDTREEAEQYLQELKGVDKE